MICWRMFTVSLEETQRRNQKHQDPGDGCVCCVQTVKRNICVGSCMYNNNTRTEGTVHVCVTSG